MLPCMVEDTIKFTNVILKSLYVLVFEKKYFEHEHCHFCATVVLHDIRGLYCEIRLESLAESARREHH